MEDEDINIEKNFLEKLKKYIIRFNCNIKTILLNLEIFLDNLRKNETISDIENLEEIADNDSLTEIDPFSNFNDDDENDAPIKIKQPNEVYYEMYKKARLEAKEAKRKAQQAYLEAKQIKDNHLLDVIDSDSDSDSDINELSNY